MGFGLRVLFDFSCHLLIKGENTELYKQHKPFKSACPLSFFLPLGSRSDLENTWATLQDFAREQQANEGRLCCRTRTPTTACLFFLTSYTYAHCSVKPFFKMAGFANSRSRSMRPIKIDLAEQKHIEVLCIHH